jgi:hypothetical protein
MAYRGLAGRTPAASYPDILQMGNDGNGLPSSGVISVCDGAGNESALKLGRTQASLSLNGGLLSNPIIKGGCEDVSTANHVNGHSLALDIFSTRNKVVSIQEHDGTSTVCTSCCSLAPTEAGVNTIDISLSPSLALASAELGYTPKIGVKTTFTAVMPFGGVTYLCRFLFISSDGDVLGDYDTCFNSISYDFVTYEIHAVPVGASYKFFIKQAIMATGS